MESHETATSSEKLPQQGALEKYKFKPFLGSSHSWAIAECLKLSRETEVLDIGCGSSAIGMTLKDAGFTNLSAIEVDKEAKEQAKNYYRVVESSFEPFAGQKFGLILLLDVLEHTPNPEQFLDNVVDLLKPGGTLLLSVPNIAHWSVRFPLLFGIFNYTSRGLLDRTHLQFFTRARVKRIISSTKSLRIAKIGGTIEPVELVLPRLLWDNPIFKTLSFIRIKIANLLPGLMAYQHVALIKKD